MTYPTALRKGQTAQPSQIARPETHPCAWPQKILVDLNHILLFVAVVSPLILSRAFRGGATRRITAGELRRSSC